MGNQGSSHRRMFCRSAKSQKSQPQPANACMHLFTGLEVLAYNLKHKQSDLKLFEAGKIYYQEAGKYVERNKLGIWMTGNIESPTWIRRARKVSFQYLNGLVHMIFEKLGFTTIRHTPCTDTWFQQGNQQGIACQHAGTLVPQILWCIL